jgi:hypothetical protein
MIPNSDANIEIRLTQLLNTIKKIYASTFFQKTKDYIKVTSYRLEEEKMAVIIQKAVGQNHDGKFYPEFSGVAKSYNFYSTEPMKSTDGIVSAALGFGKMIMEGGHTIRFCPKFPKNLLQFGSISDVLKYSQQEFFAIDLNSGNHDMVPDEDIIVKKYNINEADKDGTLNQIASTYSVENHAIYDGTSRSGARLFTLAPILKYKTFPLPEIITLLLDLGRWGIGSPVEIEFAVNLSVPQGQLREFALLQMRPLVISNELEELDLEEFDDEQLICRSNNVLGNGIIKDITDIVYVDINTFNRSNSLQAAQEVSQINNKLINENKSYLLIGVGRWGSLDSWLGIPVTWEQISGARAIVESDFKDFDIQPSQGSHFFQNLTSFKVGYFTVNYHTKKGLVDWQWLEEQQCIEEKKFVKHVRTTSPISIRINGRENRGIILKPGV